MKRPPEEPAPRRLRNAAATREAILRTASRLFAERGFAGTGVREIANEAGVDAALVNRYFESKEGLITQVIHQAFEVAPLLRDDRTSIAAQLTRKMAYGPIDTGDDERVRLLLLLQCASDPRAAIVFRTHMDAHGVSLLSDRIEGPDANLRAILILAQLTGFCIMDRLIRPRALMEADRDQLAALLSRILSACIDATPAR